MRSLRSAAVALSLLGTPLVIAAGPAPAIALFSSQQPGETLPTGWSPVTFRNIKRHTLYTLVRDGETVVVRAQASASAAALACILRADPREYPILRWRWKVDHVLDKSDITRKHGDDYPARVYITFAFDPARATLAERIQHAAARLIYGEDLPSASINYVWDTHAPVGTVASSAYTEKVKIIVVESGPFRVGRWVEEARNVYDDYLRAFGAEPTRVSGVAIMTDTDNTGESAVAWYGDIALEAPPR
jgi:hypothetical protein